MKVVIRILVAVAVIVLGYLCTMSILTPVKFQEEQDKRESLIQARLKQIAQYELSYKEVYGDFASSEELVQFLESGHINIVKADGDYTDEMRESGKSEIALASQGNKLYYEAKALLISKLTNQPQAEEKKTRRNKYRRRRRSSSLKETIVKNVLKELEGISGLDTEQKIQKGTELLIAQVLDQKLLIRDTIRINAKDSLLKNGEVPSELIFVPGMEDQKIDIQAALMPQEIGNDTINVPVFQASVPMSIYLADMNDKIREDKILRAKERKNGKGFPGLVIGSLEEVKTTGNWE